MKLFYHRETESWGHCSPIALTFGGTKKKLNSDHLIDISQSVSFDLQLKDQQLGPLIGIMTSPKSKLSLAGNRSLFTSIQSKLLTLKALSFVFSIQDVMHDGWIIGYIFLPEINSWMKAKMPFPNIIYNRIPYRKVEHLYSYKYCINLFNTHNIPLFNPGFIDKWQLYELFSESKLSSILPETILLNSADSIKSFLTKHQSIYIKPRNLSKGKNTFRLSKKIDGFILETHGQKSVFKDINECLNSFQEEIWCGTYIAQKAITPTLFDGKRFDFRILSHWSELKRDYLVTGVGIRAAELNKITTHTAYGGNIIPYEKVQTAEHNVFIATIVKEIGRVLSNKMGFFGEFSIDAGIDIEGNYVLYEVNSKPMSFDENEIEQNRIENLCQLFIEKAGYKFA